MSAYVLQVDTKMIPGLCNCQIDSSKDVLRMIPNYSEIIASIPKELKAMPNWVGWMVSFDKESSKTAKKPINPKTGGYAKSNDPNTWGTFEQALEGCQKFGYQYPGIMFNKSGVMGIDIDHCIDENSRISAEAQEIISLVDSYTEISPSGSGIHILTLGQKPEGSCRKGNLEMYDNGRGFTVTGRCIRNPRVLNERSAEVNLVHERYINGALSGKDAPHFRIPFTDTELSAVSAALSSPNGAQIEALLNGKWSDYTSQSEADLALCSYLARFTNGSINLIDSIFRKSGLFRHKWDELRGKATYGQHTLQKALNGKVKDLGRIAHKNIQKNAVMKVMAKREVRYSTDDTGNARRLRDKFGEKIRFSHQENTWRVYDGQRWCIDNLGEIKRMADMVIEDMMKEPLPEGSNYANAFDIARHIRRTKSSKGKEAMIKETQHLEGIAVLPECFDADPMLLNVLNGTLNLKTGVLQSHNPMNMITRLAPVKYDTNAKCPSWDSFLEVVFDGNEELIRFFQTSVGYSLIGHNLEQCMFILYGDGQNGKSTAVETIISMMGNYAISANPETFLNKERNGGANPDVVRLQGARFVSTTEPQEGARLNESLIKQMTGNDTISARALYSKAIQFKPVFKLWMTTNHKPMISGTDEGIWRRMRLIPFTRKIAENQRDRELPNKLRSELSGILNWAIEGYKQYSKSGLIAPKSVLNAMLEYRSEMDVIARFINECLLEDLATSVKSSEMYHCYRMWCQENGNLKNTTQAKFFRELNKRIASEHTRMGSIYRGYAFSDMGIYFRSKSD